jgi:hypothetical protein
VEGNVYVIVAVPTPTLDTTPETTPIVATLPLLLVQLPDAGEQFNVTTLPVTVPKVELPVMIAGNGFTVRFFETTQPYVFL